MSPNAKKFSATLKQSLMAYAFNVFGIVAGTLFAYNAGLFEKAPWAIAIYPPILSARGVIGGLFCGRLSTALHLGTVQPRLFGNTKSFYLLFQSIVIMTLEASILMSLVAVLFRSFYASITVEEFLSIICIVVATMALALIVISPLTLAVSFLSFNHGLDPDIVLYPVESTAADLLITAVFLSVLNFFLAYTYWRYILVLLGLISIFTAAYFFIKNRGEGEFKKTLKESLLTILAVSFIINVAGTALGKVDETIQEGQGLYRSYPVYVVYPALIDTIGDVGATVGSTATTKLTLGTLKSSFSSIKHHQTEILSAWAASLIMYFAYSIIALIIQGVLTPLNLLKFTVLLFTANVIAAALIILISYVVAISTYKRGLDPDNFEIPIESSFADSITTISLLIALILMAAI